MKLRRMGWAGHIACNMHGRGVRNAYKILAGKPEGGYH
jgi:hypothetical protein